MYCKECGASYDKAKFCPECGAPTDAQAKTINPQPSSLSPVICPVDGNSDAIQSVPAIVAAGNARESFSGPSGGLTYNGGNIGYYGGSTTLNGSLTTDIANVLAKPSPPEAIGIISLYGWCWVMCLSAFTFVGPYFVYQAFTKKLAKNKAFRERVFTPGFSVALILLLIYGIMYFPIFPITLVLRSKMNKRLDYPRRFQQWEEACSKWDKLYYCHRCGLVFNPETNEHFTPEQMHSYLHIDEYE